MPEGIIIAIAMLILAIVVAIILPMAQHAAKDPFVDVPPDRVAYIEKGKSMYNKFSDTNDVTRGNFLRTIDPGVLANADMDIAEASRTAMHIPDPLAPTKQGVVGAVPSFQTPPASNLLKLTGQCEAVKGRKACAALGTPSLKGCGVCIKGGTAYLNPDNPGKHIGGLVLLEDDQLMAEEEASGTGKPPVYLPTVGECPQGYFFVDRAACEKAANRADCKEIGESGGFSGGRTIDGRQIAESSCSAVPSAGNNLYVYDTKNRKFGLILRVLAPVRVGSVSVKIYNLAGAVIATGGGEGGNEFAITIPNISEADQLKIEIAIPGSYVPFTGSPGYRAVLLQWESVNGKRVGRVEPSLVTVNSQSADSDGIFKVLRKYGTFLKSNVILLPRPSGSNKILTDTQWMWGAGGASVFTLEAKVPGTFLDPVYSEDLAIAPVGPLISKKSTFDLLRTSPCMKDDQKPGKYSGACLRTLFLGAGGDIYRGTLARDGLDTLNRIGDGSAETITGYLDDLFITATRGKLPTGTKASITEINNAAMKMFGFEIVSPCEDIFENERGEIGLMPKVGGLDADCLDYLWTNTGNERSRGDEDRSRNTSLKNTYVSISDRYSGLRRNEGTVAEVAAAPFATCQRTGTLAPKDGKGNINYNAVTAANAKGSITAVQDFYNSIYKTANYKGNSLENKGMHELALQQCYGINRSGSGIQGPVKCSNCAALPRTFTLQQNRILGTVFASGNYRLSFDIIPNGIVRTWANILHFTTGTNIQAVGARSPGIWFVPGGLGLHVRVGDTTWINFGFDSVPGLRIGVKSSVVIECINELNKVTIDGTSVSLKQPTRRYQGQLTVYGSDPWHIPGNASISNLCYQIL
jgi:hypothetical protein